MSYGWFKAVIPLVSGLAIQRDGQTLDIRYPPGTPTFGANYISPAYFDAYHWLKPVRPPGEPVWHYWVTRSTPNVGSRVDLATVDPMLRSMVAYAQSRGILTLPSCEGHFFQEPWFDAMYRALLDDVEELRAGTLVLRDVETGALHQPRLPNWTPPPRAPTRNVLRCFSGVGRIGFSFPDSARADFFRRLVTGASEVVLEPRGNRAVVTVVVRGLNPDDLRQRWQGVEAALRRAT